MFNKTITNDDNFLEMPLTSQCLYFHLSMNADDDGFVNNWKSILKITGAKEDDLRVLITKQYVIPFDTGVLVIRHWRLNNYLRSDRFTPTNHQIELNQLRIDENNVYQMSSSGIPLDNPDRLDSIDRLDNIDSIDSIDNNIYNNNNINIDKIYNEIFGDKNV